mmetsp:Transcript_9788/g.26077  ORF Transcript_9788/g.26077 Transcript_9788/m.26077 type:complete len:99 (+) Transcript_9788:234-530(+)
MVRTSTDNSDASATLAAATRERNSGWIITEANRFRCVQGHLPLWFHHSLSHQSCAICSHAPRLSVRIALSLMNLANEGIDDRTEVIVQAVAALIAKSV